MASSLPDWVQPINCRSRQLSPAQMILPLSILGMFLDDIVAYRLVLLWIVAIVAAAAKALVINIVPTQEDDDAIL